MTYFFLPHPPFPLTVLDKTDPFEMCPSFGTPFGYFTTFF